MALYLPKGQLDSPYEEPVAVTLEERGDIWFVAGAYGVNVRDLLRENSIRSITDEAARLRSVVAADLLTRPELVPDFLE